MIGRAPRGPSTALPSLLLAAALASACAVSASPGGPPDGFAGNPPANITCRDCHGYAVGDGALALLGVPPAFTPGASYDLTVQLQDPGQRRWGFELTVIDAPSHAAGTLQVVDAVRTQLSDHPGSEPDYLKQTLEGTQNGTLNGPVIWPFQWIAPDTP
ncbi:MAG TPA: choice-of-anchor V domain-containing protein, partial [Candidatus Udaeobacter sp.]|nr:choice-of-anchor V domain-containing protein [Candidatus Udaeobacter sp.]